MSVDLMYKLIALTPIREWDELNSNQLGHLIKYFCFFNSFDDLWQGHSKKHCQLCTLRNKKSRKMANCSLETTTFTLFLGKKVYLCT